MTDYLALNSVVCTESEAPPTHWSLERAHPHTHTHRQQMTQQHYLAFTPTNKNVVPPEKQRTQINYRGQPAAMLVLSRLS